MVYSLTLLLLDFHLYSYVCECYIYMFNAIRWFTSYDLLIGYTLSWEYFHTYFLYMVCYSIVAILVDIHSQKWINISLFGLVSKFIETHISVPSFSIHHLLIFIIISSVLAYS